MSIPLLVVCGPTASGKTKVAADLAERYGGEVVSADSMQIYDEMRICTARPDEDEMKGIPHHMMGFLRPDEKYSVARYSEEAAGCIDDINGRGKLPIVAGGTGLYIDSLIRGISFYEEVSDSELRCELEQRAARGDDLYEELRRLDPEAAARIHPNNKVRVIRLLEKNLSTGKTAGQLDEESRREPSPYSVTKIGLTCFDRSVLYDRIDRRVDSMFEAGLEAEVRGIYERYRTKTAAAAIGYKEMLPYFEGQCSLDEAKERIKQATRNYAKRQLTWFRRDREINWVDTGDENDYPRILEQCIAIADRGLGI